MGEEEKITESSEVIDKEVSSPEDIIHTEEQSPVVVKEDNIPLPQQESISFTDINKNTRESIVNILCLSEGSGPLSPISGSGVIINNNGVILTNAHIGQYFLLEKYKSEDFINCVIRTGSPAKPIYEGKLLYISTKWIVDNAEALSLDNPTGTGENDYALILITDTINSNDVLPSSFQSISYTIDESEIEKGNNVLLAGYPAGFLGGTSIQRDLHITSTITQIMDIFTFNESTYDVISVGGSVVAQEGSSGGAVVNNKGELIALISTSSIGETTEERDLHAITLSHINRSFIEANQKTLQELLNSDLRGTSNNFNNTVAPELTKILTDVLGK